MSLKDQIAGDLDLFFDLDEMAEPHTLTIGGTEREISAIVDGDGGQRNSLKAPGGAYDGDLLFYAKTADLSGAVQNALIQWDGVPYRVGPVVEEDGISQVTLTAGQGGF
ncbi:hypothetical protein CAFE_17760 [Caprobacter fermentans]|uniref:Uncharacterized protein n=1 Tax=Caproicibacter fermentans TaxID=2576756 RepID=A0A6N8HYZ3_9FIRM|nr:hypothetical protein [Caproicibacter fermentans]MVB11074.1 hypothetical protein [Caproicibacter fermentans]